MEFFTVILEKSSRLVLPHSFVKILDGHQPQNMKLRQAGNGLCKLWNVEVVFDADGRMYLDRGWKQFVRAYDLGIGYFLVFRYDGNATFAVKVFDTTMCRRRYQDDDDADVVSYTGIICVILVYDTIHYNQPKAAPNESIIGHNNLSSKFLAVRKGATPAQCILTVTDPMIVWYNNLPLKFLLVGKGATSAQSILTVTGVGGSICNPTVKVPDVRVRKGVTSTLCTLTVTGVAVTGVGDSICNPTVKVPDVTVVISYRQWGPAVENGSDSKIFIKVG
ncbi:B3 domain-containing protein [Hordeum vulgare]|nr:B3 domain-containing protein [Hordeum vulgare]